MERMTAADPAHGEPGAAQRSVPGERAERILTAGRREPAPGSQQRADESPVAADEREQQARAG
jgi:hypothetical protein